MPRRSFALMLLFAMGCPAPGQYMVLLPGEQCPRATRLAFRSMTELGYRVTGVVEPTPVSPGRVDGVKRGTDGKEVRSSVRIKCDPEGVRMQPVEGALVPSDYDFSRSFGYSVKTLAKMPDVEAPSGAEALEVLLQQLDDPSMRLDLGGNALAEPATLVRVTVRNHTDRAVLVEAGRITLVTDGGDFVRPLSGAQSVASLGGNAAAAKVRGALLERSRVSAGQTVQRYLVFPPGAYTDAQVSIEDVETGESDGFVVPLQ